jgi:putative nucleotidyltransferase with HDIG domain
VIQDAPTIDFKHVLATAERVKPLPTSVARLAALVCEEEPDFKEIVEVVSYDESLTAQLLRQANSVGLGSIHPVKTVRDAAMRLGTGSLLSLALTSSVGDNLRRALPAYGLAEGELWQQSVAASIAAEVIRSHARIGVPAEVSTAALLHDFGKVVLANHFGPQILKMLEEASGNDNIDLCETELRVFGVTHADVGGLVAQQWHLPQSIVDAVTQHHSVRDDLPAICAAVSLAHAVALELGLPEDPVIEVVERQQSMVIQRRPIMRQLGIDPDLYPEIVHTARAKYDELASRFDV